jgi:beta-glucanase (GH16 family)
MFKINLHIILALTGILVFFRGSAQTGCSHLVWSDEFETAGAPDVTKWNFETGGGGWGNNELQYYTDSRNNSYVSNGTLKIDAKKSNGTWTSARMVTSGKASWKYGRFEIKAKLPSGKGTWPAIWMMPQQSVYGSWPKSGEIDIMEHVGYDMNRIVGSAHTEAYYHKIGTQKSGNMVASNVSGEFHVYAVEWTEAGIKWYVDNTNYFTFINENKTYKEWPFDQSFFLILNIAIGGDWGGAQGIDPDLTEAIMEIDYIRVYSSTISPPVVSGPELVSSGQQVVFSTPQLGQLQYKWKFPEGVAVVSGAGTNVITVKWNDQPGQVTVDAFNTCDTVTSKSFPVAIQSKPAGEFWQIPFKDAGNNVLWSVVPGTDNQISLRVENGDLVVTYNIQNTGANPHILLNLLSANDLTSHKELIVQFMALPGSAPYNLRIDLIDINGQNDLNDLFKIENPADDGQYHLYQKTFAMSTSGGWQPSKITQVMIYFNYGLLGKKGAGEFRLKELKMHNTSFTFSPSHSETKRILLIPNPATDMIEIKSAMPFSAVRIFNLAGQSVSSATFPTVSNKKMDLTHLKSGTYVITVSNNSSGMENCLLIKE